MQDKPKIFKNKLMILAIGMVFIVIVAIGIFAIINTINNTVDKRQSVSELKAQADDLKTQAIKAQENDNYTKAVELLEQAKLKYELAGDKNNAIDAEALIQLSTDK